MCRHNDEDTDCDSCAFESGYDDAAEKLPRQPEYKNWSQVNAYNDGYNEFFIDNS